MDLGAWECNQHLYIESGIWAVDLDETGGEGTHCSH